MPSSHAQPNSHTQHKSHAKTSKRKQEILQAALACFNQHGIEHTTIEMIREQSGASVGSLYHHFGNKDRIAAALFLAGMEDHHQRLLAALDSAASAEAGVRAIVRNYIHWVAEHPEWARFVLNTRAHIASSALGESLRESNRTHFADLMKHMNTWIERGQIRQLPAACYSALIIGPAHDYARGWLSGRNKADIREFAAIFEDAAWRVLRTGGEL